MSDFLKDLKNLPPEKPKVHTVCIQGKEVVVTLKKKLEVIQHGEDAYVWISATEFALKPPVKPTTQYSILQKSQKGFVFHQGDIHWPKAVVEGGESWLIKTE